MIDATRVTDILAALNARVATLTGHAEETVAHLERRTAAAVRRLEQAAKTKVLGQAQKAKQPVQHWVAVLGALAAVTLLGIVVMRLRDQSIPIAGTARAAQREWPFSASASTLPSRRLDFTTFAIPANRPAGTITMNPTNEAVSDAREPSRRAGSANDTGQQFVGVLAVESVPTGAAVFINQQRVGETPLQLTQLRAGSHVIRIEQTGYERWTTAVLVPADKETRVSATLLPVRDR